MIDKTVDIRLQVGDIDAQKFVDILSTLYYHDLDVKMNGNRRVYLVNEKGLDYEMTVDLEFSCRSSKWDEVSKELETIFNE
jgi:hypothetical protein